MYDYKALAIFVCVVEQGSMQSASTKLGMTPSAITQTIQRLETHLNIKLLNRTTRKLSLTEAGEIFYQHAQQMQKSAENAIKSVELLQKSPTGSLNIACITGLTDSLLISQFKKMLDTYTDFQLNLCFEDKVVDLLENRIDIALRAGKGVLTDNMIARHIYDFDWCIVAHPDYFANKIYPTTLAELAQLDWISFSNANFTQLSLYNGKEQCSITPNYRIHCNTLLASRRLTLNKLGISIQPEIDVRSAIINGELIQCFPQWQMPTVPLYLVTLSRIQSEKVRLACELIINFFQQQSILSLPKYASN